MKITNPATGGVLLDVAADDREVRRGQVRGAPARRSRAWAAHAGQDAARLRSASSARCVVDRLDELARTLTQEVGKPIRQSRNELNGLLARASTSSSPRRRRRCARRRCSPTRGRTRGAHRPRAAGRDRQHLGVELSVFRRRQRVRAGARRRQRGAVQALGVRDAHRACTSPTCCTRRACPRTCSSPVIGDGATGGDAAAAAGRRRVLHRLLRDGREDRGRPPAGA